jgi:hypothetical protein
MTNTILRYGIIAGLIVGAPLFAMTVMMAGQPPVAYGMAIGYLIMLVALSTIFLAIKRRRDVDQGGIIHFWPAFGLGVGISLVAGIFYVIAWESALAVGHIDFAGAYAKALIARQQAKGVGGAELAHFKAQMESFRRSYSDPLYRVPMTFTEIFPVGILVSLISAALLRDSRFLRAARDGG